MRLSEEAEAEAMEARVFQRSAYISNADFLRDIDQIHDLWHLYYTAPATVNNPHPMNPNAKTFKEWLIHLTPEEYDANVDRYWIESGLKLTREGGENNA